MRRSICRGGPLNFLLVKDGIACRMKNGHPLGLYSPWLDRARSIGRQRVRFRLYAICVLKFIGPREPRVVVHKKLPCHYEVLRAQDSGNVAMDEMAAFDSVCP